MYHVLTYLVASLTLFATFATGHPSSVPYHKRAGFGGFGPTPNKAAQPTPPSPFSNKAQTSPSPSASLSTSSAPASSYTCYDGSDGTLAHSSSINGKPHNIWSCQGTAAPLPPPTSWWPMNKTFQGGQWEQEAEKAAEGFQNWMKAITAGKAPDVPVPGKGPWGFPKRDVLSLLEAPCTSYCNTPAGTGPDPNDCLQMINADADSGSYTIAAGTYLVWTWETCQVTQNNQLTDGSDITYSYDWDHWSGVVNYLAFNCQAAENAQGGSCHFNDSTNQSWIQVQVAPGSY